MRVTRIITYIIFAAIAILGFTFAYLNANSVSINYLVGSKQLPLSLLMALALVLGGLLGGIVTMTKIFRLKRENYRLNQKIKSSEIELNQLRTSPIRHA